MVKNKFLANGWYYIKIDPAKDHLTFPKLKFPMGSGVFYLYEKRKVKCILVTQSDQLANVD